MKPLFLTLFAVLVLGGTGAGGYFYFQHPAEASIDPSADVSKHAVKKKDKHDKGHSEYVELDPLVLPILDKNGVSQMLNLVILIEVDDAETAKKVEYLAPRLKDAYIQKMYGVLSRKTALADGVLRVDVIKSLLNSISDDVLGENVAQDVLLKVVQQRPL